MRLGQETDLIAQMVQGLYDAENQLILALPRVAARATHPGLQAGLSEHLEETKGHSKRLEDVAASLGISCSGKKCPAMMGLLADGEMAMGYGGNVALVDAAVIASCQGVEHFEMSQYQALLELCVHADAGEAAEILKMTLAEEEQASRKLAGISAELLRATQSQAAA